MEKLTRLFGRSIRFAYHCFDRIVIRGYLSALSRPENIVYFYIIDAVLGPFAMRIGAYLPFYATYYLNGHDIIAPMLTDEGVPFRMKDNASVKQYEKDNTFLRIETCSNNLKDFRQKKALEHLPEVAEKLQAVNDRFPEL